MADSASSSSCRDERQKSAVIALFEEKAAQTKPTSEGGPQMDDSCYSKSCQLNKLEANSCDYDSSCCNHHQQHDKLTNGNQSLCVCSAKGKDYKFVLQKQGSSSSSPTATQASPTHSFVSSACSACTTMETNESTLMNHSKRAVDNINKVNVAMNSVEFVSNSQISARSNLTTPTTGASLCSSRTSYEFVKSKINRQDGAAIDQQTKPNTRMKVKNMWQKMSTMCKRLDINQKSDNDPTATCCKNNEDKAKQVELASTGSAFNSNISTKLLVKSLLSKQSHSINSLLMIKFKTLLTLIVLVHSACMLVQAGFWTFYFPNFLKPSGYKELTDMINEVEREMNLIKDTYADTQYFWGLMEKMDQINPDILYPEDSVCSDVFPLFRGLAMEYSHIDYEHYMNSMKEYHEHLIGFRSTWYREGEKSKFYVKRQCFYT